MADKYEVRYSRVTFPGSPCEEGLVLSTPENGWIWLKDCRNKTIDKGQIPASKIKEMKSGQITHLGLYKVLLMGIIREREREPLRALTSTVAPSYVANRTNREAGGSQSSSSSRGFGDTTITTREVPIEKEFDRKPSLDQNLLNVMHKYQMDAAKFVLARLLGNEPDAVIQNVGAQESSEDSKKSANPYASSDIPVTGCILADEMGLGKSLSALCVMWSFVRHGRGKGVIVCPSSLVGNWKQEIMKWLPGLHSKTIFVESSKKDKQVYEFIQGHSSTHPLLVISYENFRSVAVHLNKLRNWETIICDEGHRLKNEYAQTSLALGNCAAQRRLVLTGTPIQNNLDELYSVINFVCPGYFGTLEEFTSNFTDKITSHDETNRLEATRTLKQQLKRILLRRVRDEVFSAMLPPRKSYTIYCPLTDSQRERYKNQAANLLENLKVNTKGTALPKPKKNRSKPIRKSKTSLNLDSSSGDESDGKDGDSDKDDAEGRSDVDEVQEEDEDDSSDNIGKRKHSATHSNGKVKESQVLPALMELRLTSVSSTAFNKAKPSLQDAEEQAESSAPAPGTEEDKVLRQASARTVIERSGKMAVLDALLAAVQSVSDDSEKAVVVSNFQSVLDEVEVLARGRGWKPLRIDGSTAAKRRMQFVSYFNNPEQPFFLMLLSARAGGVGLNLVGGNRLVLIDPDWNPATDQQAMGRIWRDGQKKPVFIYRFISAG